VCELAVIVRGAFDISKLIDDDEALAKFPLAASVAVTV
jgi:hypothetical protein